MVVEKTPDAETENREADEGLVREKNSDDNDNHNSDSDSDSNSDHRLCRDEVHQSSLSRGFHRIRASRNWRRGQNSPIPSSEQAKQKVNNRTLDSNVIDYRHKRIIQRFSDRSGGFHLSASMDYKAVCTEGTTATKHAYTRLRGGASAITSICFSCGPTQSSSLASNEQSPTLLYPAACAAEATKEHTQESEDVEDWVEI